MAQLDVDGESGLDEGEWGGFVDECCVEAIFDSCDDLVACIVQCKHTHLFNHSRLRCHILKSHLNDATRLNHDLLFENNARHPRRFPVFIVKHYVVDQGA